MSSKTVSETDKLAYELSVVFEKQMDSMKKKIVALIIRREKLLHKEIKSLRRQLQKYKNEREKKEKKDNSKKKKGRYYSESDFSDGYE